MTPHKIIFAGTPEFAAIALQELINSPHEIVAVYTQPDRPAGRGRQLTASPVKVLASKHNLPIEQPESLRVEAAQTVLANYHADVMVVAAYGLILPSAVLKMFPAGCINIHPSLLPRWRGAAPIQRTLFAGDETTGVTIMQMTEGLDCGPMLFQVNYPIAANDTSASLHDVLAKIGADALLHTLADLSYLQQHAIKQDESKVTYAHKITKAEAELDWHTAATILNDKIRAFNPWPVAQTISGLEVLRVWQAEVLPSVPNKTVAGMILQTSAQGIDVATGDGVLRLQQVQISGARVMSAAEFLNAQHDNFRVGKVLG